jgi:hypothetical protein
VAGLSAIMVLAGCGLASGSSGQPDTSDTMPAGALGAALPGDASCDEVMTWTRSSWQTVRAINSATPTPAAVDELLKLSHDAKDIGVRTEDPLLSLIATSSAFEALLAGGKPNLNGGDIRQSLESNLQKIAQVCQTSLA